MTLPDLTLTSGGHVLVVRLADTTPTTFATPAAGGAGPAAPGAGPTMAPATAAPANPGAIIAAPAQAAGQMADRAKAEARSAIGPWIGLAVLVLGIVLLFARDRRLKLIGFGGGIVVACLFIFAGDQMVALVTGLIHKVFG